MYFPEEFISQIRDENDIVDVISNYVPLKKGGANYKGLCPFHSEKTPSFMVSPSKQIFHCFGCGEGGDLIRFLMKHENLGFPDTVRVLAERCGRPVPETRQSPEDLIRKKKKERLYEINRKAQELFLKERENSGAVLAYLKKRAVSEDSISTFGIGYAPDSWDALYLHLKELGFQEKEIEEAGLILQKKNGEGYYNRFRNRILFPIVDVYDRVLGFGGRVLDDSTPKYLNSPETPLFDKGSNLYGLNLSHEAIRKQDYGIIVEGYMDLITAYQEGIRNIVATLGTALTERHLKRLRRYTRNIALFFDSDEAGFKAAERCFDLCVPKGMKVKVVTLDKGEDPDSFLRKHGKKGFSEKMAQARPIMDFMIEQIMGDAPPHELEEKVAVADRLSPLLSVIPNPIEKELYLKKISSLLGIEAETLHSTLRSGVAKTREIRDTLKKDGGKSEKKVPVWEGKLLGLMMNHPNLILENKEKVELDYFSDPDLRLVAERFFEAPEDTLNSEGVRSLILPEDAPRLSKFFMKEQDPLDNQGIIDRLHQEYLKNKKKKLDKKVEVAERTGRSRDVDQLIREISQISLEMETFQQKIGTEKRDIEE